jgi:hypothetical protein
MAGLLSGSTKAAEKYAENLDLNLSALEKPFRLDDIKDVLAEALAWL